MLHVRVKSKLRNNIIIKVGLNHHCLLHMPFFIFHVFALRKNSDFAPQVCVLWMSDILLWIICITRTSMRDETETLLP